MNIDFKMKHNGKTANQVLATCRVCRSQAGEWVIFSDLYPFCIIVVTEDYDLIFNHFSAADNFGLICGKQAKTKAKKLLEELERLEMLEV